MSKLSRALPFGLLCMAATVHAQEAGEEVLDTAYVLGQGETRQVQGVTSEQIDLLPAGTSALKAIENLPGVNFQSADPFGTYEWSTRITVRGFNQGQLGFTLDGVPLGDMSYGNHNGLHVSRAVASELVAGAQISQGAGALDTASTSNLGGTLRFTTADPDKEFGVRAAATGGSESTRHLFARLDTGSLGAAGTRALFSVVDHAADKWRGGGKQEQRLYTVKLVQPVGQGLLTGYFNYSDRAERDYQDLSYDIIERRGWKWDNWYPDWQAAVDASIDGDCTGAGYDAQLCDDAYWNAAGLRKDKLGYIGLVLPLNDVASLDAKVYHHGNKGAGLWGTPYLRTSDYIPGAAPLSMRTTEYDMDRNGLIASLQFQFGINKLQLGGWYEDNDFNQARRFYPETDISRPTIDYTKLPHSADALTTQWEYDFGTKTTLLFLQDEIEVSDRFTVNAGFKSVKAKNQSDALIEGFAPGTTPARRIQAKKSFLPQAGLLFRVDDASELFASVARNMRAFQAVQGGVLTQVQAAFDASRANLKPETSTTFEAGWRYNTPGLFASAVAYHVDFKDRQLSISQGPGIVGNPPVLANVGDVKTNGFELALGWKPVPGLTWFNSFSYNDSTFADDYVTNGGSGDVVVPVKDKNVPDAPKTMFRSELSYETGGAFIRLDGTYTAKRYYTYLNDNWAKSYALFNASGGYRFGATGALEELTLQLDLTNLFDKKYISTVGSNGFTNSDPNGTGQTLLNAAPRQVFVSLKAKL